MNYRHFSVEEREAIQQGLWGKKSYRAIARELGRSPTSVSREVRRNLPPERFLYTPRLAHERALKKRKRRGREDHLKTPAVRAVEYLLNTRPRKRLGWKTPYQVFYERTGVALES